MKLLFYRLAFILMCGMLMFSCKKPEVVPGNPDDPGDNTPTDSTKSEFVIEISEITTNSAKFRIIPEDETMTYTYLAREKSVIEGLSDEEIFQMDMEYFEITASQNGVDIIEYLDKILARGEITLESGMSFKPNTEYCLYCYGLTKYKEYTTGVNKKEFRTENISASECTFEISVEVDGCRIIADIRPSDKSQIYWEGIIQESLLDLQYEGDLSLVIKGEIDTWILYAEMFGVDLETILSQLWLTGDNRLAHFDLVEKSNYTIYCAAIDKRGNVTSEIASTIFATTQTTPSKNKFTVRTVSTTHNYVSVEVTPEMIDPYLCQIVETSVIEGLSEKAIQNYIIDNLDSYEVYMGNVSNQGQKTFEFEELEPGTEYTVCVFGYETVATTDLNRTDITTIAAGNPDEVSFDIKVDGILDRSAKMTVSASDITVTYIAGAVNESEYTAAGGNDQAIKTLITQGIEKDIEYGVYTSMAEYIEKNGASGDLKLDLNYLKPGSSYIPFAVCVNKNGEFLSTVRTATAFTTGNAELSDASIEIVYSKHFNGDQMADYDYSYDFARGKALIPVTLKASIDAAHSYFLIIEGDLTSESDENLIPLIWKYGVSDKVNIEATAPWNKTVTLCAIGQDADGYIGKVTKIATSFTKPKASPVDEYGFTKSPARSSSIPFSDCIMSVCNGKEGLHISTDASAVPVIRYDENLLKREILIREKETAIKNL